MKDAGARVVAALGVPAARELLTALERSDAAAPVMVSEAPAMTAMRG